MLPNTHRPLAGLGVGIALAISLAVGVTARGLFGHAVVRSQSGASEVLRTNLGGEVYDASFDPSRRLIWYALFAPSGDDYLESFDPENGAKHEYRLPDVDYNGFLSRVEVDSSGIVWVTEPYRLVRFDPNSSATAAAEFPVETNDAFPNALDPANPLPGTWISAIAIRGQDVLVARNNIPFLTELDAASLAEVGKVSIPNEFAGAVDMATGTSDELVVTSGETASGGLLRIGRSGEVEVEPSLDARRIVPFGAAFAASGSGGVFTIGTAPFDSHLIERGSDLSRAVGDGHQLITYDATSSQLHRYIGDKLSGSLALQPTNSKTDNPVGADVPIVDAPHVNALILADDGTCWYVDGNDLVQIAW